MKEPLMWYSLVRRKKIFFDDLDLDDFCAELEKMIDYYREDPCGFLANANRTDKEILELFLSNLHWLFQSRRPK